MRRSVYPFALLMALVFALVFAQPLAAQTRGEVAVTIDDLPQNGREFGLGRMKKMTEKLTRSVASHKVPAVGFVNEAQLFYAPGEAGERIKLLDMWLAAGLELGNHTYAHRAFREITLAEYQEGVVRGETVTKILAARHNLPYRYFRHPYLDTGPNLESRDAFDRFVTERGYTIAPVTMDGADWMFGLVYGDAKSRGDKATMRKVVEAYLAFTDAAIGHAETMTNALFHRPIRHVMLMHANELNAEHFDEIVKIFERRGYGFVTLERALQDEAYREPNSYARSQGLWWLDRWVESRNAQPMPHPDPPAWVWEEYQRLDAVAPARIPGSRN